MSGTSTKTEIVTFRLPKSTKAKLDTILDATGVSLTFVMNHYVERLMAVLDEDPATLDLAKLQTYVDNLADRYGNALALYKQLITASDSDKKK